CLNRASTLRPRIPCWGDSSHLMRLELMLPLPVIQQSPPVDPDAARIVEVSFKGNRRGYYSTSDDTLRPGEYVLVEAERGRDLGRVLTVGGVAARKCSSCGPSGSDGEASANVVRRAEAAEVQKLMALRADEERV